ncbi:MAG: MFS transporter [Bacillota bacterium]|jgi:MFS family permease|uniref:MFS transporter n=1 Tax=Cytobacillus oceanisediminis 2691 TaxID=1196031 RepID=A0A160MHL5_9BACI|nr:MULTISPECIES: MFS transporter [Bacillaceae]AND42886.1 MFS transporter [Cytobacillus oceanisediminis 2691]MBN8202682.1 MFS transporter [Bacillus sp. NTK034]MCM3244751.1 MFS transporter [Cytobacillus oceanisediminis]UQX56965.1 MFS transporter [Cytobacillus pseudoceanisediminis]USK47406.1 MFS transporter [Cytobacillus oceanisediminis]
MVTIKDKMSSNPIIIVALVTALSLLGDSMLYIALPIYWETAGIESIWQVGVLLSINRFIRLPFNPLVGWMYKRISLKTGLIIAVLLGGFTTIGYGVFEGFIAWVILRAVWGIAWSFFRIGGLSVVALYSDNNKRGSSMGLYNGLYRTGSLVGMLIGGLLVPIIGLSTVSVGFGILTLLGLPLILKSNFTQDNETSEEKGDINKSKPFIGKTGYKVSIIVSGFLIAMLYQGILTSTLSPMIEHFYGEHISILSVVISVTLLSGIIQAVRWAWEPFLGRTVGQWSDGSRGRLPIFIVSLIFAGVVFGMISIRLPLGIWIVITLLVMAGATILTTLLDTIALDTAKTANVVSFLTIYSISQDVGAALGPALSFILIQLEAGFNFIYWGGAVTLLILAIIWSVLAKRLNTLINSHNKGFNKAY